MIDLENFNAGHYEPGFDYKYFVPSPINDDWCWSDASLNNLLEKAAIKLGELNSFSRLVPNIELFIQLHVAKEAVISSRIEGTQTRMDEALLPEMEISPERRDDWREVNNYIVAMNSAISDLAQLPISSRLMRQTHKLLLNSVRGEHKSPGEFRTSQNWIGGRSIADAKFVPPSHHLVAELMGDLEKFLNNDQINMPALMKIAIAHYQFETIHPFLDGNGRIGRLLITLFLVKEGILNKPLLYLSNFFETPKDLYYDNLSEVRLKGDMLQWIKYFLVGVEQTASLAASSLSEIIELKAKLEGSIRSSYGRRANNGILLLHELLKQPFVSIEQVSNFCKITYKSANELVKKFCEDKILVEMTGQSRNRLFVFESYLSIFDRR
ncbi:MAG: Fic family protein [Bacteroides sp.]|nr:Fic family protein [Bacteroides sp.]